MKINCSIAEDLLPLYLEEACSVESRAALEAHLGACPGCRKKLERMRRGVGMPPAEESVETRTVAAYAGRIRRRRTRTAVLTALGTVLAAVVLALGILTVQDMRAQAEPVAHPVEAGVWNLTAAELETTAEAVGEYVLYTNNEKIRVTVPADYAGEILLWIVDDGEYYEALYGRADPDTGNCDFTNLSAAQRYRVTCGEETGMMITVSEGRETGFFSSLKRVLNDIWEPL